MKNLLFIGLLFVLLTSISCTNDTVDKLLIDGVWVETIHKTDTLVFNNQYSGFVLNRGTEISNSYLLPKSHSGVYFYAIDNNNISLRWGASSSSIAQKYYFTLDSKNKEIKVGNFFVDSISSGVILSFTKIH